VILACRNAERAARALTEVAAVASGPPPVTVACDLADLASVRRAAAEIGDLAGRLDVVINNAGLMAVPLRRTEQGFESQFGVNHLAHFALDGLLVGALAPGARIVAVSSHAHRMARIRFDDPNWHTGVYNKWIAYGQSKLANLLFVAEGARRAAAAGADVTFVAAHPGYADTHLQTAAFEETGARLKAAWMRTLNKVAAQPDRMGALPQIFAATMPDVGPNDYSGPGGLGEWRGLPARVSRSDAATNGVTARRLWGLSETLTGVFWPW
jgi:NAD(P)-dependent dehydrogenase (short-subunit alcohol dehydrogenase family)